MSEPDPPPITGHAAWAALAVHNTEILCGELGLSRDELTILAENRVI